MESAMAAIGGHGFFIRYRYARPERALHEFCGSLSGDSGRCPTCGRRMVRYLGLDTHDACLGLPHAFPVRLPLLYCWRCALATGEFIYRVQRDGSVAHMQFATDDGSGGQWLDPYPDYPDGFMPVPVEFVPISEYEARVLAAAASPAIEATEDGTICLERDAIFLAHGGEENVAHQLGGWPPSTYDWSCWHPVCPVCRDPLMFLASFLDCCTDRRGFTGDMGVELRFHICGRCLTIAALNYAE